MDMRLFGAVAESRAGRNVGGGHPIGDAAAQAKPAWIAIDPA
jgi:hypothetical protein